MKRTRKSVESPSIRMEASEKEKRNAEVAKKIKKSAAEAADSGRDSSSEQQQ